MSDPLESDGRPRESFSAASTFEDTLRQLRAPQASPRANHEPEKLAGSANRSGLDEHLRTGNVLSAVFPEGHLLRSQDDFAAFHLFSRLMANVTRFADTGMAQQGVIEEVVADASALNDLLARSEEH